MKRRSVLAGAAGVSATVVATALTAPKPALAQGQRVLKMVTAWPRNFPGLGTSANRLARSITDASDGELTVKLYAAGELVPAGRVFDAVSKGEADMYHAAEYYWEGKSKAFNFFASVPFGMTALELDTWLSKLGGQELWDTLSGRYNIKAMAAGNTGVQMGGWSNKRIETPEELKGLKIRMPGLAGEVLRRLGARTVSVSPAAMIAALKSGRIDATEWLGPWSDMALGLHKAARFYYWPGFQEPGTMISLGINRGIWDDLKPRHRRLIELASHAESQRMLADFNRKNSEAIFAIQKLKAVDLVRYPKAVLLAFAGASEKVIAQSVKGDAVGEKIHASFMATRAKLARWMKYSDESYLVARRLPFAYSRLPSVEASAPDTGTSKPEPTRKPSGGAPSGQRRPPPRPRTAAAQPPAETPNPAPGLTFNEN